MTEEKNDKNYVYIVKCSDGTLYTGWTNDVEKRIAAHNSGSGAKYTRGRAPVAVLHLEECDCREDALRREAQIKKMTRKEKLALVISVNKMITVDK